MFFELLKVLSFFLVPSNIMVSLGLAGIALLAIGYARAGRRLLIARAGVEFIDENGGGPGVRLRKRQRDKQSK